MSVTGNYTPPLSEREYFTHKQTGDRGYLVTRNGELRIKHDQDSHDRLVSYNHLWERETPDETIPIQRIGEACFEIDRIYCHAIGKHGETLKKWRELSRREKDGWMNRGPREPSRRKLWTGIRELLGAESD